jgi:hypothetical protein
MLGQSQGVVWLEGSDALKKFKDLNEIRTPGFRLNDGNFINGRSGGSTCPFADSCGVAPNALFVDSDSET